MFEGWKRSGATPVRTAAETQEARLGAYLTKHDIPGNASRRERLVNKATIVLCGALATIAGIEAICIAEMIPLYKVVPLFVTFSDKADQVVRIEPPSGRIPGIRILIEQDVRDYIVWRNTISADQSETIDRWGTRVRLMSSEEVYKYFLSETKPVYEQLTTDHFTRSVAIRSLLVQGDGLYQVEFDTFDHHQGTGLTDTTDTKMTWIAQLRVDLEPRKVSYDQRGLNPIGLTVREYSVARKRG